MYKDTPFSEILNRLLERRRRRRRSQSAAAVALVNCKTIKIPILFRFRYFRFFYRKTKQKPFPERSGWLRLEEIESLGFTFDVVRSRRRRRRWRRRRRPWRHWRQLVVIGLLVWRRRWRRRRRQEEDSLVCHPRKRTGNCHYRLAA